MRLLHISDLHLGKRLNEFSLIEDQKHILNTIVDIIRENNIEALLIAGDVYDKTMPTAEAVTIFDAFLTTVARLNIPIFIISGNHDSAERLSFGAGLMRQSNVYISNVFNGTVEPVKLNDAFGEVNIYLLPFIKPIHARLAYPEEEIDSYETAVLQAVKHMDIDESKRNVILVHQFVAGATTCGSEEKSVGGLDTVNKNIFSSFDYVALGHIHSPQRMADNMRYSGSILKYSVSEAAHAKSAVMVDMGEKGDTNITLVPLVPMRDLQRVSGEFQELIDDNLGKRDERYTHVVLLDQHDVPNAVDRLRAIYPNLISLEYDNARTRAAARVLGAISESERDDPFELFSKFYENQNGISLNEEQTEYLKNLISEVWEDEV